MTENNTFYCSFVGNQYIICECGENFPSEDDLRLHLESCTKANQSFTEYKCGECGNIYATEKECVEHQDLEHIPCLKDDHSYIKDVQLFIKGKKLYVKSVKDETSIKTERFVKEEPVYIDFNDTEDGTAYFEDGTDYITDETVNYTDEGTVSVKTEVPCADGTEYIDLQPEEEIVNAPDIESSFEPTMEIEMNTQDSEPRKKQGISTFKVLSLPKRQREAVKDTESVRKKKPAEKNVVCEVCGKKYASNAALRYHQRVHTGVRPYQCSYCPKNFTLALFLQIHVRTHTGERPYKCQTCPKAFGNRAALLRHNRVHTGEKPYKCPQCGKTFTQSNSMKLHVHTVHLKLPAPYKSARRKAESQARAARQRRTKPDNSQRQAEAQQIVKVEPEVQMEESFTTLDGAKVYFWDMAGNKEEVTYELVYE